MEKVAVMDLLSFAPAIGILVSPRFPLSSMKLASIWMGFDRN